MVSNIPIDPVSQSCRIHRPHFCRGVRPPRATCPGYDQKPSDGETIAMLEF